MKKLFAIIFAAVIMLGAAGCSFTETMDYASKTRVEEIAEKIERIGETEPEYEDHTDLHQLGEQFKLYDTVSNVYSKITVDNFNFYSELDDSARELLSQAHPYDVSQRCGKELTDDGESLADGYFMASFDMTYLCERDLGRTIHTFFLFSDLGAMNPETLDVIWRNESPEHYANKIHLARDYFHIYTPIEGSEVYHGKEAAQFDMNYNEPLTVTYVYFGELQTVREIIEDGSKLVILAEKIDRPIGNSEYRNIYYNVVDIPEELYRDKAVG